MVVDDDESTLRMIRRVLGKNGFKADYYADPREALAALESGLAEYDVLISDYQMDEMNGVELATQARFLNKNLKILILSGLIKSEIVDACQRGRIDGRRHKPPRSSTTFSPRFSPPRGTARAQVWDWPSPRKSSTSTRETSAWNPGWGRGAASITVSRSGTPGRRRSRSAPGRRSGIQ